jgi:membrane protease YdiL (CAAX protease family)
MIICIKNGDDIILGLFPIAPMLIPLLLPVLYCFKLKNNCIKKVVIIVIVCVLIVLFYPITSVLDSLIKNNFGYFFGKLILFTFFPLISIFIIEKWKIKEILIKMGLKKRNLVKSIIFGFIVLIITLIITLICCWETSEYTNAIWNIIMFFDAFNEEFLFRGYLFLYLWRITEIRIAYVTSILAFILAHPQHFTSFFLISTVSQGILITIITHKTKNIIGSWISHGLNRVIPQLLKVFLL